MQALAAIYMKMVVNPSNRHRFHEMNIIQIKYGSIWCTRPLCRPTESVNDIVHIRSREIDMVFLPIL